MKNKTYKVVVACSNSIGEPDFHFCRVNCSDDQLNNGEHYDAAIKDATNEGYEGPYVAYDQLDSAGKMLMDLFIWKSSNEIGITKKLFRVIKYYEAFETYEVEAGSQDEAEDMVLAGNINDPIDVNVKNSEIEECEEINE